MSDHGLMIMRVLVYVIVDDFRAYLSSETKIRKI